MNKLENLNLNTIKLIYKNNFTTIQKSFVATQSTFLSDIYKRYNYDLGNANIVLYFSRRLHKQIIELREEDMQYDISLNKFWENHSKIKQKETKIIEVSKSTGLPKETARRKIDELIELKILKKDGNRIFWMPTISDKASYNSIVEKHISHISELLQSMTGYLDITISKDKIKQEILKHFSFYQYHYLNTQLNYIQYWQKKLNDLEILLISLECAIQSYSHAERKKTKKNFSALSATTISAITGIPRATCIRKLEKLHALKKIKKDSITKKYYLELNTLNSASIFTKDTNTKTISLYSFFYSTILRNLIAYI